MHGGVLLRKFDIKNDYIKQDIYQDMYQNKIQTESKNLLNKNQIFNTKNQSADYLIEYFEGMILNYISLNEEQGIRNDKLKNFILNHDKNKFKGGDGDDENNDEDNVYIKNHDTYKYYKKDEYIKDENILKFSEDNWKKINIEINIDYQKEYNIYIKHNNNGLNKIDLIIDLHHNTIIDNIQNSYNNALCDSTKNITYILSQITKTLLKYIYKNNFNYITLRFYNKNKNDIKEYNGKNNLLFRGIISLLIMILTLKNNIDENIYKKYNTTFLLSSIYEKIVLSNDDSGFDKFVVNNKYLLTYNESDHLIRYNGDCALNTLMCIKNADIRKLFVDKISFSQDKFVKEKKKEPKYYINKINKVLEELSIIEEFNDYINKIKNKIKAYNEFVNFVNNEYLEFKEVVENKKYMEIDEKYQIKFEDMRRLCSQFIGVVKNNLLDYDSFDIKIIILPILDKKIKSMDTIYYNESVKASDEYYENLRKKFIEMKGKYEVKNEEDYEKFEEEFVKFGKESGEKINYDHTNSLNTFITIMDNIILYKESLNIFYINFLILLLLIKHKINYIFDTNIMKIFKYSKNKIDIIKCFRNICYNENEYVLFFPTYQKGNNDDDKYLFKFVHIRNINHAAVLIININTNNDKMLYLYDINDLNMYFIEKYDKTHSYDLTPTENEFYANTKLLNEYYIDNKTPRWFINDKYKFNILDNYKKDKIYLTTYNMTFNFNIIKNLDKINIFNEEGNFDFRKLNELKYDDCNDENINFIYYNYKKLIFKQLLDYCNGLKNEYIQSPNNDFLYTVNFINDYINKNIINYDNNTRNLLYKFIDCLVQCKYNLQHSKGINIDLDEEYKNILKYMTNTYSLAIGRIGNYLNFIHDNNNRHVKFIELIIDIMKKLRFWTKTFKIVYGGDDVNTNCYDSILKKVLIILLIIVIIIIIVLIVLYIINKYKNNKIVL